MRKIVLLLSLLLIQVACDEGKVITITYSNNSLEEYEIENQATYMELFIDNNLEVDSNDIVIVNNTVVDPYKLKPGVGDVVVITVVDIKEVDTKEVSIEYDTINIESIEKNKGEKTVTQVGVNGVNLVSTYMIYYNGEFERTEDKLIEVISVPVDEIILVGTYIPPTATNSGSITNNNNTSSSNRITTSTTDQSITEPPITEPPITEPPITEPPITEPSCIIYINDECKKYE